MPLTSGQQLSNIKTNSTNESNKYNSNTNSKRNVTTSTYLLNPPTYSQQLQQEIDLRQKQRELEKIMRLSEANEVAKKQEEIAHLQQEMRDHEQSLKTNLMRMNQ